MPPTVTTAPGVDPDGRDLRRARPGLLVLALACLVAVTTELLPVGLLPAIGADLGTGEATTGLLVTAYAAMVMALAVPITLATRRVPGRRLLVITMAAYALGDLVAALAPTFGVLLGARVVGGAAHALFFSVCIGLAARLVGPAWVGRALALVSAGISAGLILGAPAATAVGNAVGWRLAYAALAVPAVVTGWLLVRLLPDTLARPARAGEATGRRRDAAVAILGDALAYLGYFALYTYVAVLLEGAGAGRAAVAPILLGLGLCGLLGTFAAAPLLDRHPRRTGLVVLSTVTASMVALGAVAHSLPLVVGVAAAWAVALGPFPALFQSAVVRTRAITPELAGAWVNTASNVGIAGGSALGAAALSAADIRAVAWLGAAFIALALLTVALGRGAFPHAPATGPRTDATVGEPPPP
jgi:predicted MFS family arabinose efflux permease